jgi:pyruvate carboxylase
MSMTTLPARSTSPFFYGLLDREEISIDIDKGKTRVVRRTGRSDTVDEEG